MEGSLRKVIFFLFGKFLFCNVVFFLFCILDGKPMRGVAPRAPRAPLATQLIQTNSCSELRKKTKQIQSEI